MKSEKQIKDLLKEIDSSIAHPKEYRDGWKHALKWVLSLDQTSMEE